MNTHMFLRVVFILCLAAILAGCGSRRYVVPPDPGGGAFTWQVQRMLTEVWASTDAANPNTMPKLTDNANHNLVQGGGVTTDVNGEARLFSDSCSDVYIYQVTPVLLGESELVFRACSKDELGACARVLSTSCDNITVQTVPGNVTLTGSWALIIYSDRLQLLMVAVADGSAAISSSDNRPPECGPRTDVKAGQFAYIYPPQRAGEIQSQLPSTKLAACQPQPTAQMSPFVNLLGVNAQMGSVNRNLRGASLRMIMPEQ